MVRRSLRAGLWLGLLFGLAWSLRRMLLLRRMATGVDVSRDPWTPLPQPAAETPGSAPRTATAPPPGTAATAATTPPVPTAPAATAPLGAPATATKPAKATKAAKIAPARTWMAAPDGGCPPGHPVKAKTASHIFRVPGMSGYDQTRPDRCYRTEEEALADGFTRAKR